MRLYASKAPSPAIPAIRLLTTGFDLPGPDAGYATPTLRDTRSHALGSGERCGELLICQLQSGSGRLTLRGRLLQLDFIWTRVDDKEQIALAENLAIAEMDFGQVAADFSAQSDLIHSGK